MSSLFFQILGSSCLYLGPIEDGKQENSPPEIVSWAPEDTNIVMSTETQWFEIFLVRDYDEEDIGNLTLSFYLDTLLVARAEKAESISYLLSADRVKPEGSALIFTVEDTAGGMASLVWFIYNQ